MGFYKTLYGAALVAAFAAPALAQDMNAIEARQGQFKLYGHNIAVLGGMAQGRMDYDAEMAQTAADNLFHLTRHDQSRLWPEGTDSSMVMETRAKAEIWENLDDFTAKFVALQEASAALQGVAGDGLDALRPAVGAVGASCGACHEDYREES
ncbi:MAG: Cytochrome c556 [Roseibaca calidilacus]|uniref:Cytochrome c556 n=1 Tax=Roseibaca calidilacus TaxID=1666912 RepID=A0A0P7WCF5_9RHOB|nr:cytochrome c [Roseibaca calidilacus]KPP95653.1 MAG: Cytochrome c556 [Roseibaca calidilacus]CUX81941.1 Cytochrome c556 [Roseibaca calidilacus]